jgi:hypothetical protein
VIQNSNEEELKRQRRSLLGKVKRRRVTMEIMRNEIWEMNRKIELIELELAEYKKK